LRGFQADRALAQPLLSSSAEDVMGPKHVIWVALLAAACGSPDRGGNAGDDSSGDDGSLDTVDGTELPPRQTSDQGRDAGAANAKASATLTVTLTGTGTITSSPAGLTCSGATCTGSFPVGTTVTLSAGPAAGGIFTGWSGACSGATTCAATLKGDATIGAAFQAIAGTWSGTFTNTRNAVGCTFQNTGNLTATVTASGTTFSTSANMTGLQLRNVPGCNIVGSTTGAAPASAVVASGTKLTGTWTFNVASGGTLAFPFTATAKDKTLTGTWTCQSCTGGFTLTTSP
jgi:hypothetical protein